MYKKVLVLGLMFTGVMFLSILCFAAEEITITTYYPSPSGSYKNLTVSDRQAIGDLSVPPDGKVNQDDMAVDSANNPIPGSLTVKDRIGIGIKQPGLDLGTEFPCKLHIYSNNEPGARGVFVKMNNPADSVGYGVYAQVNSDFTGVYGRSDAVSGIGVFGYSKGGIGVFAKGLDPAAFALKASGKTELNGDVSLPRIPNALSLATDGSGKIILGGSSSKRYKKDIRDLEIKPEDLFKLRPVKFRWKENNKEDVGLIAEEVKEAMKDLVIFDNENKPQSVKYDKVAIYLLGVVKNQQKEINTLKTEISELKVTLTKKK